MLSRKTISRIKQRFRFDEDGQALVVTALLLFFAFLAFSALAVDGSIIYLHRRKLQNIADAATLAAATELATGKTTTEAYQAAIDVIAANDGLVEWYVDDLTLLTAPPDPVPADFPGVNVGSGQNLTMGIEVNDGCDARVALQWSNVNTYFAQFVGREFLQVGARARTDCSKAGGLQPIAMKRFGDDSDLLGGSPNCSGDPVCCDACMTNIVLSSQENGNAYDFFRPISATDEISAWPGWPDHSGLYANPTPHATMSLPGRPFFFFGNEAEPNQGRSAFNGAVNLDVRRLGLDTKGYNGINPGIGLNSYKDWHEEYIRNGYCCDIPEPGDWVTTFDGVSDAFGPKALRDVYDPGDIISIIIYDGHVFQTPTFSLAGEDADPLQKATYPTTNTVSTDVLSYTITLESTDGFKVDVPGLLGVEGLEGFADWRFSNNSPKLNVDGFGDTTDVTLYITPTVTTGFTPTVVTGTRMFYVTAKHPNVWRYWAGVATIGDRVMDGASLVQRQKPAVTGIPTNGENNYPYLTVARGNTAFYDKVFINLWETTDNQNVTMTYVGNYSGPDGLPNGFSWGGDGPTWGPTLVRADGSPQATFPIKLDISSTTTPSPDAAPYELPFLVAQNGITQTFKLYVFVEEEDSSNVYFVEILGYAAVEILGYYPTDSNPNRVYGRFVSELYGDYDDIILGLRPRLIPWED